MNTYGPQCSSKQKGVLHQRGPDKLKFLTTRNTDVAWIRQENPGRVERYGKEMVEEQDGICGESDILMLQ